MPFTLGDVVRLKAHPAQQMTIVEIDSHWITCRWFDHSAIQEVSFPASDLEPVVAENA
jgi:uncharacterized protein YodC (DUF2158 family)